MKYKVVSATSIQDMEKQVNELITKGWRPKAGMTAGANGVFYQAMVTEDVKKGNQQGNS